MSACPRPDKTAYPSRRMAMITLRNRPRHRRVGLHAYRCRCGAWHLGRLIRRPIVAWRSTP